MTILPLGEMSVSMRDADLILHAYLHSTDETEQKRLESELLQTHAAPIVRRALLQRLGFYIDQSCADSTHSDAADLYQEAMVRLLQKLSDLRSHRDANGINHFGHYVVRLAINICNEYLRDKTPERSSLNHNLRDLLSRHRDFSVWRGENNSLLCGFAVWEKQRTVAVRTITPARSDEIIQSLRRSGLVRQDLQRFPTGKILSEIFEQVGGPIEFDRLAEMVAAALMIKDLPPKSLDQNEDGVGLELIDAGPLPDARIEGREMLQQLWEEVKRMPAIQRDVFCFRFSDYDGEDFFSLITRTGIATLKELTEEFGVTPEQLAEICKRTPMDVEEIARHFGVSRQQVSKLSHRAVIRLLDRLTKK